MRSVLIDTDVVLDFLIGRKPFNMEANIIFTACETKQIKGYLTPIILSNTYYIIRKTENHDYVISLLKSLLTLVDIIKVDREDSLLALNSEFNDFEDALQNFSAENNGEIDAIITRNYKDYKKSKLGIFTPKEFLNDFLIKN